MIPLVTDVPYALELRIVSETRVPIVGWRRTETRSYATVRFEPDGEGWSQVQTACAVEVDGGRVSFPARFVESLPTQQFGIRFDGPSYSAAPEPSYVGVMGPVAELPTEPGDPRVFDQDGDGEPGVTVLLDLPVFGAVEAHIVQAGSSVYRGEVVDGAIVGRVDVSRLEQETLSATNRMFARSLPTRVIPGASSFRILPDPDLACRDLFRRADATADAGDDAP